MEQAVATLSESSPITYSLAKPLVIKDVTLLTPGIWTGEDSRATEYTLDEIKRGYSNSNWENMNLFLDHKDSKGSAVAFWVGFVRNPKIEDNELKGDLEIWHPLISLFIKQAKAKFGVSAMMNGKETPNINGASNYQINSFRSMSLVDEPGCATSWLPKMLSKEEGDKKVLAGIVELDKIKSLSKVTDMETKRAEMKMSVSEFYAVPRDPPSSSSLPIFDESHVRNAIARFNQTNFDNPSQKKTAWSKITSAAKRFKIEISEKKLENCKEVDKMTEENQTQENKEKVETTKPEVSVLEENPEVKNLSSKIDKLTEVVTSLSETVKTLSAENAEPVVEEVKTEEKTEDAPKSDELEDTKKDLDETKKELAVLKSEMNSPDEKTLSGVSSEVVSTESANAGMLGFLRESANIPIY